MTFHSATQKILTLHYTGSPRTFTWPGDHQRSWPSTRMARSSGPGVISVKHRVSKCIGPAAPPRFAPGAGVSQHFAQGRWPRPDNGSWVDATLGSSKFVKQVHRENMITCNMYLHNCTSCQFTVNIRDISTGFIHSYGLSLANIKSYKTWSRCTWIKQNQTILNLQPFWRPFVDQTWSNSRLPPVGTRTVLLRAWVELRPLCTPHLGVPPELLRIFCQQLCKYLD